MRAITTNWNNSAYNSAGTFLDRKTGTSVTIPANTPVNFRGMVDSVESGAYSYAPDTVVADPGTLAPSVEDVDVVEVTVTLSSVAVDGAPIKAVSDDVEVATVSPAFANANSQGKYIFTITSIAEGEATITFTSGSQTDTCAVTVS